MSFGRWVALNIAPLFLRVSLGAVFIWAGSNKLFYDSKVTGAEAAALANLGIIPAPITPALPPIEAPSAPTAPAETPPADAQKPQPAVTAPANKPSTPVDDDPSAAPAPETSEPGETGAPKPAPTRDGEPKKPELEKKAPEEPAESGPPPAFVQLADDPARDSTPGSTDLVPSTTGPATALAFTADQFGEPVTVKSVYRVAAGLHMASQPDPIGRRLWPPELATPTIAKVLAWAAALTEFLGGALVLVGFLTRFWSLGLASVMIVAMLLTTIGPAALDGTGLWGFLPKFDPDDPSTFMAWTTLFFQFALFMSAMSLTFLGPGGLSIDRLIFKAPRPSAPAKND